MTTSLTPADFGFLAAALDDARSQGLGDDATCDILAQVAVSQRIAPESDAWRVAHDFLRANPV